MDKDKKLIRIENLLKDLIKVRNAENKILGDVWDTIKCTST